MALAQTRPSGAQSLLLGGRLGGGGRGRRFRRSRGAFSRVGLGRGAGRRRGRGGAWSRRDGGRRGAAVVSSTITVGGTIVTTVWSALELTGRQPSGSLTADTCTES